MYQSLKKNIHVLLHPQLGNTRWDKFINSFIIVLIVLNVFVVMLETVKPIYDAHRAFFHYFDLISVIIFTIEYILRVWSSNVEHKYRHPIQGRIKYMFSWDAIIDLVAILPFYVHAIMGLDLRVLWLLRLLRFLRLFRLTKYMKSAKMVRNVFLTRANELKLSIVLIIFLIIISSSLLYFAEHNAQPEVFTSIPATFWWAIVTVTSIGYGDMVPITILGKIFTGIISLSGLAIFALPAGIVTAGFLEEMEKNKQKKNNHKCPHCGMELDHDSLFHDLH